MFEETEFEIFWSDLTSEAQARLLEVFKIKSPEEMNWDNDTMPITTAVKDNLDEEIFQGVCLDSKLDQHLSQP